jgi:putative membrane protein
MDRILALFLMVLLDVFLEQICDYAGSGVLSRYMGWFNYLCWFVIALVYRIAFVTNCEGISKSLHTSISFNLYSLPHYG